MAVEAAEEDRWETSFATPMGLFQFKRMPIGPKGAPASLNAATAVYTACSTLQRHHLGDWGQVTATTSRWRGHISRAVRGVMRRCDCLQELT